MKWTVLLGTLLASLATDCAAQAAAWPTKPVKIMVGASAGGGTDIIARMLAEKYQAIYGQPFVIENRPGAGNTIAADVTAHATDGHTLLLATNSAQAIAPHMIKLSFDPIADLAPVALVVVVPNVVAVGPAVKATNIRELVAELKSKQPGEYSCGSSGIGSTQHLACEAFGLATGTKITHVPYKGSAPVLTGPRRRADPARLRHDFLGDEFHQGGEDPGARRHDAPARGGAARRSDARRSRRARRGDEHVVWPLRRPPACRAKCSRACMRRR
jgi:tripartite-type tricarboxylate transporter receptor subunit TctC